MHYSSHLPCAFRNRIARYLGVLVGAALVATLGLPSAVQAQTTGAPMVEYMDGPDAFTVSAPHALIKRTPQAHTHWVLEVDGPVTVADKAIAAEAFKFGDMADVVVVQAKGQDGVWKFRLSTGIGADADDDTTIDASEVAKRNTGPWMSYLHGKPDAPEGFAYAMSGTNHIFTWEDDAATLPNVGIESYWLRWTSGEPTLAATKWTPNPTGMLVSNGFYNLTSSQTKALEDGKMYTFQLRALGTSSSTTKGTHERRGSRHGAGWHGPDTDTPGDGGVAPRVAPPE